MKEKSESKTDIEKYGISEFKKGLARMYASEEYIALNQKINRTDFFKVLGVSRNENCHSEFIAWLLNPKGSHGLGDFALRRFMQMLVISSEENENAEFPKNLKDSLLFNSYMLNNDYEVKREYPIPSRNKTKVPDRLDILVYNLKVNQDGKDKKIFILIENKVLSDESDNQTRHYYEWAKGEVLDDNHPKGSPICVFLSPNKKQNPECNKFITIRYQDLVRFVIEPCMAQQKLSEESRFYIREYLNTLSYSCVEEKGKRKGELIMAFSSKEIELCRKFKEENYDLFSYVDEVLRSSDSEGLGESLNKTKSERKLDTTKYSFNGDDNDKKGYSKRMIALKIIKEAAGKKDSKGENMYDTAEKMNNLFEDAFDKNTYVKNKLVSVEEKEEEKTAKYYDDNYHSEKISLRDKNGKSKDYIFTNQWGKDDFDKLKEIAEDKLGCKIEPIKKES